MKTMKLIYPLVFALALTVAVTGCKRGAPKTTPLPGQPGYVGSETSANTLPNTTPFATDPNVSSQPGAGPLAGVEEFENMIKDPAALAAYTVHFKYDSSAIAKSEQSNLQAVAAALSADSTTKLLIEGNCDERGTEEYNRSLGERRALAAREALAKLGVDPMRVRTVSYGKDKPVDTGHDEAAWAKNRRADFILLHPKTGA